MFTPKHPDPFPCPNCGSIDCNLVRVKKFSGEGAIKGALVGGPFALPAAIVGGIIGGRKGISECTVCGYQWEVTRWRF